MANGLPIQRPNQPSPANSMGPARTQTGISPTTASRIVRPGIARPRERIMLCGDTVAGKTYAYHKLAEYELDRAKQAGEEPPRFFVIDTDDALGTMLGDGFEFSHLYFENGGNIYPYPAFSYDDIRTALGSILRNDKPTRRDWIVVDVINRVYERAQEMVASLRGKDLADAAFDRLSAGKGFGAFEPSDWNLVNRAYLTIQNTLAFQCQANILLVCHIKPIIDVEGWERRENLALFDAINMRPEGSARTVGAMDTAICIWAVRRIAREGNRRVGVADTVRYMWVAKDRGRGLTSDRIIYGDDLFATFREWRASVIGKHETNITDPKAAADLERELEPRQLTDRPVEAE